MDNIIGIDISKSKFDVAYLPSGKHEIFENSHLGIQQLIKQFKQLKTPITMITLEHTGGYEKLLLKLVCKAGFPVHVAAGSRIHYFARAKGYLSKTDKQDAWIIAKYAQENVLDANGSEILKDMELRELQSRQNQLKKSIGNEKKHLDKGMFSVDTLRSIRRTINYLSKEIILIDKKIAAYLAQDKEKQEKVLRYQTVKGIGIVTARSMVVYLPELGQKKRGEIAALAGVAPVNRDSGIKQGYRRTLGGRPAVKHALYMAALSATRFNPVIKDFYQKLLQKGKKPKVAIMAVMRKLVLILNALQRDKLNWQDLNIAKGI